MWMVFGAAWAGVPVVTTGDLELAREVVAARTGLPGTELEPVSLTAALVGRPAVVLGNGALRLCAGAPVEPARLEADLARARVAASSADPDTWTALDRLVVQLGCAGQVTPARLGADLFALRVQVRKARADAEAEVAAEEATHRAFSGTGDGDAVVRCLGCGSTGPWVDGRPVPADGRGLTPGLHLFQYASSGGIRTAWLTVGGAARVVVPAGIPATTLAGLSDPAIRPTAEALLDAALDVSAAYVAEGGGVWLVELGDTPATTELTPPPTAPGGRGSPKRR